MKYVHLLFFLVFCLSGLCAQIPAGQPPSPAQEQQARAELSRRNIDETELKTRLKARGIDVDTMSPTELAAVQPQIEAVIAEMEAEKRPVPAESSIELQLDTTPLPETDLEAEALLDELPDTFVTSEVWGHQLFRNKSLEVYKTTDNVRPPDSYRLGVGDAVAISIFGASQADLKFIIDNDGFIRPPSMPRIYLKGITLGQARELVESRFRNYYVFREGQFSFNIDAARTITVNIFGETERNGSFTLSAVNTAFNALVAAGGPTEDGSVREIKLLRDGEEMMIDIYEFLLDPTKQADVFLENNDVIFVPLAKKIVLIKGAIKRPYKYELLPGEDLSDLIDLAGGFMPRAVASNILVNRVAGGEESALLADYTTAAGKDFELQSSDFINVRSKADQTRSYVSISGEVDIDGDYSFNSGMTIVDLLNRAGLTIRSRKDVAFLRRANPDGTINMFQVDLNRELENPARSQALERGDALLVFSIATYSRPATFSVRGAVENPIPEYPFSNGEPITVEDAILLAGGLKLNASNEAFLIRVNPENLSERQYIRLDLDDPTTLERPLRPFDNLDIYTNERFSDSLRVTIRGAVRVEGTYIFDPSLGLPELFTLAGGLKEEAALNKVDVFRLEITQDAPTKTLSTTLEIDEEYNLLNSSDPDFRLRPHDVIVVREVPEYEPIRTVEIRGEVRYPGYYALDADNLRLTDLVRMAGGKTNEAFLPGARLVRGQNNAGPVVIRMADAIANPKSVDNITLKNGDLLTIPKALDLVGIIPTNTRASEAYSPDLFADGSLDVAFNGKHSAKWYIDNYAAGFTKRALRRSVTVEYANGEMERTKKILFFNNYPEVRPGSIVRVQEQKPPKREKTKRAEPVDWARITQAVLGGVTTTLTLYLLIDRIDQ